MWSSCLGSYDFAFTAIRVRGLVQCTVYRCFAAEWQYSSMSRGGGFATETAPILVLSIPGVNGLNRVTGSFYPRIVKLRV